VVINGKRISDRLNFKVVPTLRMIACYGKLENSYDGPILNLRKSLISHFKIFNKVAPKGRFKAKLLRASRAQVNVCAKNRYPNKNPNRRYPRYWNHLFLFAHGGEPVFMNNKEGHWIEKDEDRIPQDVDDILRNSTKYYSLINQLKKCGDKIQNGHNLDFFKIANEKKNELEHLKRKPLYENYIPVSYLSFKDGGYWPRQLFAGSAGLEILSLSCWDWWSGGAGKPGQTACVTVAKRGKKLL